MKRKSRQKMVLMCPPKYYEIAYEINPWMDTELDASHRKAVEQWHALYKLLKGEFKWKVELLPPERDLPDMTFTADAGFVLGKKFISSNFRFRERQGESRYFMKWFRDKGFEVVRLPKDCAFEGMGDFISCGNDLFAGYTFRSGRKSHNYLKKLAKKRIITLRLVDAWFYHLNTCFCPLDEKTVVYYPKAFDRRSNEIIKRYFKDRIAVDGRDAYAFGCCMLVAGKRVILNKGPVRLKKELKKRGYKVYELDLSEFVKSGGSVRGLVLDIT